MISHQMPAKILVVEDEAILRRELITFLQEKGYQVGEAESGEEALRRLQEEDWAIILLDIALPGISGIEVLRQAAALSPATVILVMTAFASLDTAIESLRLGAYDYLKKPIRFEELLLRLQKLDKHRQIVMENQSLRRLLNEGEDHSELIGESLAMQRVYSLIESLKEAHTNVLISGESGVGKELVARALHLQGPTPHKPFIPVNVSAIPETMLENQLFGHHRGAFTGADSAQVGVFEAAEGGTVFLDEIGELPLGLQPRLLRAIEQKEIFPLGANSPKSLQFRVVAATNRDLEAMVEEGTFRQDLFYRLNVFHIEVPPLRERREDIPLFVQYFVKYFSTALNKSLLGVEQNALQKLVAAEWKGNVRELRNVIERAAILANQQWIGLELLPPSLQEQVPSSWLLQDAVWEREREHILTVLQITEGNKEKAAKMLGIGLATLYRRLEKMDLPNKMKDS